MLPLRRVKYMFSSSFLKSEIVWRTQVLSISYTRTMLDIDSSEASHNVLPVSILKMKSWSLEYPNSLPQCHTAGQLRKPKLKIQIFLSLKPFIVLSLAVWFQRWEPWLCRVESWNREVLSVKEASCVLFIYCFLF